MPAISRRDGFALPITIFLVTIITLMLAALYARVQADRMVAESTGDMVDALAIAQGGLQSYFASTTSRPSDADSTRINVTGGYADVVVQVVQRPADTTLHQTYLVRSTGYVIVPTMGSTPQASRTVAQFAEWQVGTIDLIGAFAAANRVQQPGGPQGLGSVDIRGADQCGSDPATVGLRTRNGSSYPSSGFSGSPPVLEQDNAAIVAAQTGIDWEATITGGFAPDYTTFSNWDFSYSSWLIPGNLNMAGFFTYGTGLLIVTGNLDLSGTTFFIWNGVVLVGGEVVFGSNSSIYGALISGLQGQLQGGSPPSGDIGRTGTFARVHHCSTTIATSLAGLTGLVPVTNGWVDNWATY